MRVRLKTFVLLALATVTTIGSSDERLLATAPPVPPASCTGGLVPKITARVGPKAVVVRPVGQVRHFDRANITVSAGPSLDGAIEIEAGGGDLRFRKKVQSNGRYSLEIGAPRDKVLVDVAEHTITVTRGKKTITITPETSESQMGDVRRMLADSRALDLLRSAGATFDASGEDSAASTPIRLADALVGTLTGDIGAARRAANHLSARARSQLRPVSDRPNSCYYQWEQTLLWAYMELEECVMLTRIWPGWCSIRWTMQAESAWFSLISCSGFGF